MSEQPETVICNYQVKSGHEAEFEALLSTHWPALHDAGLTTDTPPLIFRGRASGKPDGRHGAEGRYVEIFEWKHADAAGIAHQTPEIMAVWEPMGAICSDMDFPHFDPIDPIGAGG
ncbi:MAG: hypothetical protein O7E54_00250 [Planctomycetota bacterium]|nr:hypothetical protein [Planctomycetota bacterium]